jgi:hypothetical protein
MMMKIRSRKRILKKVLIKFSNKLILLELENLINKEDKITERLPALSLAELLVSPF